MATRFVVAILLAASVLSLPSPAHEHAIQLQRRGNSIAVTGTAGGLHPRIEISRMEAEQPQQHTLLILAMAEFQARAQEDVDSYYQIAGIHGVPHQDWDGSQRCSSCEGADGYCPHDMAIFPTWHRAYMALFEQEFLQIVNQIANQYSGSQLSAMQDAASSMRFPYWDWAARQESSQPIFPQALSAPEVTVSAPNGTITIPNPLYQHSFANPSELVYSPFTNWANTLRYPSDNSATATSQEQQAINGFGGIQESLQDQVYQLFTTCDDWLHFSNDDAGSSSTSCSNSLEGIHNTIHNVGGGATNGPVSAGHMTYLPLAAFDPLFWLHHMNVDRLFAMWQTLHPNAFFDNPARAPHDTWAIPRGAELDANTPLAPFYKDFDGNYWTSNDVKDWRVFNYDYPEFYTSDRSPEKISDFVNQLYGASPSLTAGDVGKRDLSNKRARGLLSSFGVSWNPFSTIANIHHAVTAIQGAASDLGHDTGEIVNEVGETLLTPFAALNGSNFQYVANIQTPRYALNGSYYVYLFNTAPKCEDPTSWLQDANLIGPMGILGSPGMVDHGLMTAGSIPLTRFLTTKVKCGELNDLSEATVVPYLTKNLQWRIAGADGRSVNPDDLHGFQVAVYASTSSPLESLRCLPTWTEFIPLAAVTHGKCGGAAQENADYHMG